MNNTQKFTRIPVYTADEDAAQFIIFQQYYEPFNLLLINHVFEQKDATISLDFDHFGTITKIRRSDLMYRS